MQWAEYFQWKQEINWLQYACNTLDTCFKYSWNSTNSHLSTMAIFWADKSYTDSCLNLSTMATSLQRSISSVPMVAIMNRFNSYFWQGIYLPFSKCKLTCTLFDCWKLALFICFCLLKTALLIRWVNLQNKTKPWR